MALSSLSHPVRHVAEAIRAHRMDEAAEESEMLVLGHRLAVLERQVADPLPLVSEAPAR